MKFKNEQLSLAIQSVETYPNVIINDIGRVKTEERTDGKVNRLYYVAAFNSLENPMAKRKVTMFQDHNTKGDDAMWSSCPNPARLKRLLDAGDEVPIAGFIAKIVLNTEYEITNFDGTVNKTNLISVYVPHKDETEKVFLRELTRSGVIEKEPATTE